MKTKRNFKSKKNSRKKHNRTKSGKKWLTAVEAAQQTLNKTGSLHAARKSLKRQALINAKKLFGSVGTV